MITDFLYFCPVTAERHTSKEGILAIFELVTLIKFNLVSNN